MYTLVKVRRDGSSCIVTLPLELLKATGIKLGDQLIMETTVDGIKVKIAPTGYVDNIKIEEDI